MSLDAPAFFEEIALANYYEYCRAPTTQHLWNTIFSMNTVAEFVALHRLCYSQAKEKELSEQAGKIRQDHPALIQLNEHAITLKHVRRLRTLKRDDNSITTSSTGFSHDQPSTLPDAKDVLEKAVAVLKEFPEFR